MTKLRIGSFSYHKDKDYPEKNSREVKWMPITTAGKELAYSGLREVFDKVIAPVCP